MNKSNFKLKFLLTFLYVCAFSRPSDAQVEVGFDEVLSRLVDREFPRSATIDKQANPSIKKSTKEAIKLNNLYEQQRELKRFKRSTLVKSATVNSTYCPFKSQDVNCDINLKYRTYDGSCNNVNNKRYGMSNMPYKRLLQPAYDDGKDLPRGSKYPLPNVRNISLEIATPISFINNTFNQNENDYASNLFTHFGQFITHDLTQLSTTTGIDRLLISSSYSFCRQTFLFIYV
jgi:hypothetical protein